MYRSITHSAQTEAGVQCSKACDTAAGAFPAPPHPLSCQCKRLIPSIMNHDAPLLPIIPAAHHGMYTYTYVHMCVPDLYGVVLWWSGSPPVFACCPYCFSQVLGCVVELFGEVSGSGEVSGLQAAALQAATQQLQALAERRGGGAVQVRVYGVYRVYCACTTPLRRMHMPHACCFAMASEQDMQYGKLT